MTRNILTDSNLSCNICWHSKWEEGSGEL